MTVAELIEALRQLPQDSLIAVEGAIDGEPCEADTVEAVTLRRSAGGRGGGYLFRVWRGPGTDVPAVVISL